MNRDIVELCKAAKISQPTFYKLFKQNSDFSSLVYHHRQKYKKSYTYDDAVLEWLIAYFSQSNSVTADPQTSSFESAAECSETAEHAETDDVCDKPESPTTPVSNDVRSLEAECEALKATCARLEAENEYLKQIIESEKKERDKVYMLLAREQEKLLPAPPVQSTEPATKPTLFDRLFHRIKK